MEANLPWDVMGDSTSTGVIGAGLEGGGTVFSRLDGGSVADFVVTFTSLPSSVVVDEAVEDTDGVLGLASDALLCMTIGGGGAAFFLRPKHMNDKLERETWAFRQTGWPGLVTQGAITMRPMQWRH